ncbi:hypothetical protein TSOC_003577 [Tetrabaena socialis]|uniref:Uncharacterized protein n=1 Tax=Tetrabaena socialis TaxID=47790 RepID=A0A2J8AB74_9CHLO|nr:hypothetical protein TSOC_003577 [Tetrabaena socialis]|eukprot:PNH09766.1 hypothetical protein TSOC_003577 [Tetrabaena socialis]
MVGETEGTRSYSATSDNWWTAQSCALPGPVGVFPYSFSSFDVCGGAAAITQLPLLDGAGTQLGSVTLFRGFDTRLSVTVALGIEGPAVALYRQGTGRRRALAEDAEEEVAVEQPVRRRRRAQQQHA